VFGLTRVRIRIRMRVRTWALQSEHNKFGTTSNQIIVKWPLNNRQKLTDDVGSHFGFSCSGTIRVRFWSISGYLVCVFRTGLGLWWGLWLGLGLDVGFMSGISGQSLAL
jgi:hypothetical protein